MKIGVLALQGNYSEHYRKILEFGASKIDYIKILDVNKLIKPYRRTNKHKIFIAYYLGSTRLIDNI